MKSTWTGDQQQYHDNMKSEIKNEINQMNKKIDDTTKKSSLKLVNWKPK